MATGTAATAGSVRLAVFWFRAAGTESGNVTSPSGTTDHIIAQILIFRGCATSGNPFSDVGTQLHTPSASTTSNNWGEISGSAHNQWINGTDQGAGTSVANFSTTVANSLLVAIFGHARDAAGAQVSSLNANTLLSGYALLSGCDNSTTTGTGGGFAVAAGSIATAGLAADSSHFCNIQTTTSTVSHAIMLLALVPPSTGTLFTQSFTPTCSPTAALGPFRTNKVFTPTQTKTALLGPKNLFKLLTATQNRTGLLNKATAHGGFVATLSSSGAFSKGLLYARQFAATLFGGSGGGSPAIDDTYSETNRSNSKLINPPVTVAFGQTFTSSGGTLVQVRFYLFNTGSTTGNATVSLYALSGGLPTGSALATSDPFDTSTLTGFPAQAIDFAFSGVNQYSMVAATSYAIVINFAGANLNVEVDDTSPTHSGSGLQSIFGSWSVMTGPSVDLTFVVYVAGGGGPAATLARLPQKSLTATLSRSAVLTRSYLKTGFTATLSFVGGIRKLSPKNFAATLFPGGGGGSVVDDSYSETNTSGVFSLLGIGYNDIGQTFVSGGGTLIKSTFYCRRVLSPTGNVFSKLYALSAGVPTGSALAVSDAVVASTLSASTTLTDFNFSGVNQITLAAGTSYGIVVEFTGGDASNYVQVGTDATSPTHSGDMLYFLTAWALDTGEDVPFYVYVSRGAPAAALSRKVGKALSAGLSFVGTFAKTYIAAGGTLFTQSLAATLSFTGGFSRGWTHLQAFTATLFHGTGGGTFPATNLDSYYPMEETSGTRFDVKGSNNLTDHNSLGSATGIIGNSALMVAASGSYLSLSSYHAVGSFACSFWFYMNSNTGNEMGLFNADNRGIGGSEYWAVYVHGDSKIIWYVNTTSGVSIGGVEGLTTLATGQWYHAVFSYDDTTGNLDHYLNNTLEITHPSGVTPINWTGPIGIGQDIVVGSLRNFDGRIDELALFQGALSSTDVATLWNGGAGLGYSATGGGWADLIATFIAGGHAFTQALTATLTSTAALTRRTAHGLTAATLSFVGALTRRTAHKLTATLSFVGATVKRTTRFLAATLSFSAVQTASKSFLKSLTATLSFVGAMSPREILTRAFTATLAFSGSLTRFPQKAFAAIFGASGSLVRKITNAGFTATLSFVGAATKRATRSLAATLSFIGTFAQNYIHGGIQYTQSLFATLSFVGTFNAKQILTRAFTATLNATATLSLSTRKAFAATLAFAASLAKRISRTFSASASLSGALVKFFRDAGFTATLSFVGTLGTLVAHFFTRAFTATLSFSAAFTRSKLAQRVFAATLAFSATLRGRTAKVFAATLSFSTAARKAIRKVFAPVLSFIGFIFRGGAVTVLAGWITKALASIQITGSTANIQKTGSQLTVEKLDESGVQIQVTGSQLTVERTK
jgi:hypothetical protein